MQVTKHPIVDKNNVAIEVGCTVRIKYCDGPYGQTSTIEGIIQKLDQYYGAKLTLTTRATLRGPKFMETRNPGDEFYLRLPCAIKDGKMVCSTRNNDFEHRHEAWVSVIKAPLEAETQTPTKKKSAPKG